MVERVWRTSYTHTILGVLCREIDMYRVSDLKFILPEYAMVLTAAHEQMSRNDFLLTAAILTHVHAKDFKVNASSDIARVQFDKYLRSEAPGGTYDSNQDMFLGDTKVTTWRDHYNLATNHHHCYLEPVPEAERIIFSALGLSEVAYRDYALCERQRLHRLALPKDGVRLPAMDIVSMEFSE
jgi:hypothetical protein